MLTYKQCLSLVAWSLTPTLSTGHVGGAGDLDVEVRIGGVGCLILHQCVLEFEDHGLDMRIRVVHTLVIEVAITGKIVDEGSNCVTFLQVR